VGGTVVSTLPEYQQIHAVVPLRSLEKLAEDPRVKSIRKSRPPRMHQSDAEGVAAHMADKLHAAGIDGAGIKVGVISNSIDNKNKALKRAIGIGAMDAKKLVVLDGQAGWPPGVGLPDDSATGEGLAMAEIVHAIAPGATIYFATALPSEAQMATNILNLAAKGCQIIVDDVSYPSESPFQAGPISRAVDTVAAKGVLYFSSAGNSGNMTHQTSGTWEGDFNDSGLTWPGNGKPLNLFGQLPYDEIAKNDNYATSVSLYWNDPLGKSTNEYDVYLTDENDVVLERADNDTTAGDPYQVLDYSAGLPVGGRIYVVKVGKEDRFLHLEAPDAVFALTGQTNGSSRGHNAGVSTITVAAARVPKPVGPFATAKGIVVEPFSSDGPRRMFFAPDGTELTPGNYSSQGGRLIRKPDITAADGVTTSLKDYGLGTFSGTSAAAPHAAAIAALLLQANPGLAPNRVRFALRMASIGIETPAFESVDGYGVLIAPMAVGAAGPENLYVANSADNSIRDLDNAMTITGGGMKLPGAVAYANGKLYVANFGKGGISVFDTAKNGAALPPINAKFLFNRDANMTIGGLSGHTMYVFNSYLVSGISMFDVSNGNKYVDAIKLSPSYNGSLAYADGKLYVSLDSKVPPLPCKTCPKEDAVAVLDATKHYAVAKMIVDPHLDNPYGMAVGKGKLYVANERNNTISVFNTADDTYVTTISDPSLNHPRNVAYGAGKLYVTNYNDNSMSVFDTNAKDAFVMKVVGLNRPQGIAVVP
ncbi:MAG: hypothetical protein QOJ39_3164, partial [Candidatus Eremiobacteraeota bacterium]|nr:hypothetical protein [Candidatus Eremiobacteraeota bacterium]